MLNFKRKKGEGMILTIPPSETHRQIFIKVSDIAHVSIEAEKEVKIELCSLSLEDYRGKNKEKNRLKKLVQREAKIG